MAQQGVFGEVLHAEGAYIHNLEDFWPYYWNNWRMDYNQNCTVAMYTPLTAWARLASCSTYPPWRPHELRSYLWIPKPVNGPAYIKKTTGKEVKDFQNGDQTSTSHPYRERQDNPDPAQRDDTASLQPHVSGGRSRRLCQQISDRRILSCDRRRVDFKRCTEPRKAECTRFRIRQT